MAFFDNNKRNIIILLCVTAIHLIFFGLFYGFRPNNDTESFVLMINFFRGTTNEMYGSRYLSPFYPVVSSKLFFFLSPALSITVINIIFYSGIIILTYDLIRRVFKNNLIGFLSAFLIITNYAMIRYGLTQVQDMGGYFWCLATMYCGWRWYEMPQARIQWLLLGSVCTAFGLLTKESGAMGSLFFGILIVSAYRKNLQTMLANLLFFAILPATTIVINFFRGKDIAFNSLDWFIFNWNIFYKSSYTFLKWFGINFTTFNFLWLLFFIGGYWFVKNYKSISYEIKLYLLAVIPVSVSYMAWPIFISRTVVISMWLIVPIAALALNTVYERKKHSLIFILCIIAFMSPYVLQSLVGYTPVFVIIDQTCHYSIPCTIKTFLRSRVHYDNFVNNSEKYIEQ